MSAVSPTHQRAKIKRKKLARISGFILLLFLLSVILLRRGNENIQVEEHAPLSHTVNSGQELPNQRRTQSVESAQSIEPLQRTFEIAEADANTPTSRPSTWMKETENHNGEDYAEVQTTKQEEVQQTPATATESPTVSHMTDAPTNRPTVLTQTPSSQIDDPSIAITPNTTTKFINGTHSFGGCMCWMDDMERLIEWVAYHYHTLPLRQVIIYRDPKSTRDLSPLVDRWRPYGMKITVWTSLDDFPHFPVRHTVERMSVKTPKERKNRQLTIQQTFIRNCLKQLKVENHTWTFVGDPDEFLALNSKQIPKAESLMKRSGVIMEILRGARATKIIPHTRLALRETQLHRWGDPSTPCMCLGRKQFSGYESPHEAVTNYLPNNTVLDPYRFQTLRFRHHRRKGIICKSIVDVSAVEINMYKWMSHHRIFKDICGDNWGRGEDLMHVHHHFGSLEYFKRPNDYRGGEQREKAYYEKNAWVMGALRTDHGDETRQWLGGFIEYFGEKTAMELLEGVGFPYNNETALERIVVGRADVIVRPENITAENESMAKFQKRLLEARRARIGEQT